MDLANLPPLILIQTVLDFPIEEIIQLCTITPNLNQNLCENEYFWHQKFLHDFGQPDRIPLVWREAYHRKRTGQVYTFGNNYGGLLGLGDNVDRNVPTLIPNISNIKSISVGVNQSLILSGDGHVYSFGWNSYGQLGLGNYTNQNTPTLIPNLPKIVKISSGAGHNLLLDENGQVWSFGYNEYGQLGLGDRMNRNTPVLITLPENATRIQDISAGGGHSLILDEQGKVYSFGYFVYLGLDNIHQHQNTPVLIPFTEDTKIQKISAGGGHNLIMDENNLVYAFGLNNYGQLGLGDNQERNSPTLIPMSQNINVKDFSTGSQSSIILTQEGRGYAFGLNFPGNLNVNDIYNQAIPTLMLIDNIVSVSDGQGMIMVLTQNNQVHLLGRGAGSNTQDPFFAPMTEVKAISTNGSRGLILTGPFALFSTIRTLIQRDQIQNTEIISESFGERLMEFTDIQGEIYRIKVRYDPATNQIFPLS